MIYESHIKIPHSQVSYKIKIPKLVLFNINLQINRRALLIYYLFLAVTLKLDTFIWQRLVYWYLFCVLYIIVILQNIENAFNFFISIFLGRGRFINTFALNFVWGVFPLLDISQIFHPLTSYKNISYLWNKSTAWIDY